MPDLSVIVAAQDAGPNLRRCLAALVSQLASAEMEVLVIDGSERDEGEQVMKEFPGVHLLRIPAPNNVPRLWSAGITAARGKVIALTIENCVPASDWAQRMLCAHAAAWPGVGGAIEADLNLSLVDWAVYFSRYSSYMLPFSPRFLDDLPADNCSYKRDALAAVRNLAQEGFWETFIHSDMRRRNQQLLSDPSPVVTYCGGLCAWRFLRRRYLHGRYFAARRGREMTKAQRMLRAATFLAVPPLLIARIAGRVWKNGRYRTRFVSALPLLSCFLLAWAAGEATGYFSGAAKAPVGD